MLGPPPEKLEALQLTVTLRPLIEVVGVLPAGIVRAFE